MKTSPSDGPAVDLRDAHGYLVVDRHKRPVGTADAVIFGHSLQPEAFMTRRGHVLPRWSLIPADAVDAIDAETRIVALRVDRDILSTF